MCVFRMPDLDLEALHVHLNCGVIDTLGLFGFVALAQATLTGQAAIHALDFECLVIVT